MAKQQWEVTENNSFRMTSDASTSGVTRYTRTQRLHVRHTRSSRQGTGRLRSRLPVPPRLDADSARQLRAAHAPSAHSFCNTAHSPKNSVTGVGQRLSRR